MKCFLLCSFVLVLFYFVGIDMYLVGLLCIVVDLNVSELQLYIVFFVYLVGMVMVMLFVGKIVDQLGCKLVVIVGVIVFMMVLLFCLWVLEGLLFLSGCFFQGIGVGGCYVVVFVILCDMFDEYCWVKVLLLLNGIICIVLVFVLVVGYLIMFCFFW